MKKTLRAQGFRTLCLLSWLSAIFVIIESVKLGLYIYQDNVQLADFLFNTTFGFTIFIPTVLAIGMPYWAWPRLVQAWEKPICTQVTWYQESVQLGAWFFALLLCIGAPWLALTIVGYAIRIFM